MPSRADPFDLIVPVGEPCPVRAAFARAEDVHPFDAVQPVAPTQEQIAAEKAERTARARRAEAELERLLWHMPSAARHARSRWGRQFADSMAKKGKRRGWRPTPRQRETMAQIVAEMLPEDGVEVIE